MTQIQITQIDSTRIAEASHGLQRAEIERSEKVFSVSDWTTVSREPSAAPRSGTR